MKPSERILATCAVILTIVAVMTWLRFDSADYRAKHRPEGLPVFTNQIRRIQSKQPPMGGAEVVGGSTVTTQPALGTADGKAQAGYPGITDEPLPPTAQPRTNSRSSQKVSTTGSGPIRNDVSIRGAVFIAWDPPKPRRIRMEADPACAAQHPDPAYMEDVLVNSNGTLRNVFVYISAGLEDKTFEVPKEPVILDQRGCIFEPHVLGIQINQQLRIRNGDRTTHNTHMVATMNPEFNKTQPPGTADILRSFKLSEVMVSIRDDIQPWMKAYIGVLPHPFFAVTGEEGTFAFGALPPGEYTLTAWHEVYGIKSQQVTVVENAVQVIHLTYQNP